MADKKRNRNKRQVGDQEKPTKEEYAVSKYLRFNVANKDGKFCGMPVTCFIASEAVDLLLKSKWGPEKCGKSEALFPNRYSCISYCDRLLQKGMFHRVEKVERKKDPGKKKKKRKEEEEEKPSVEEKKTKKDKDKKGKKDRDSEKESDSDKKTDKKKKDEKEENKDEKKDEEKKKKERKLKLDMHDDQRFIDGEEYYVWIYDPVPAKTFIIGLAMVLGAIGLCLFPLWPPEVRLGVYYLSLLAAGFVGVILALIVIRFVLFCTVWVCTIGKHHFWFLPNLTEDVGFFDSFKPLYHHATVVVEKKDDKKSESKSKKEKSQVKDKSEEKSQDKEQASDKEESENDKNSDNEGFELVDKTDLDEDQERDSEEQERESEEQEEQSEEEKESKKDK